MCESDIHDQVRQLLREIDGENVSSSATDLEAHTIKTKLVSWMNEGIRKEAWKSWGLPFLVELMEDHGPGLVVDALEEVDDDVREQGLLLPNFLRRDLPGSTINLALMNFQEYLNGEMYRKIEEEKREQLG